jgi:hypothetical protein
LPMLLTDNQEHQLLTPYINTTSKQNILIPLF